MPLYQLILLLYEPLPTPHRDSKRLMLKITRPCLGACPPCFLFTIGKGPRVQDCVLLHSGRGLLPWPRCSRLFLA